MDNSFSSHFSYFLIPFTLPSLPHRKHNRPFFVHLMYTFKSAKTCDLKYEPFYNFLDLMQANVRLLICLSNILELHNSHFIRSRICAQLMQCIYIQASFNLATVARHFPSANLTLKKKLVQQAIRSPVCDPNETVSTSCFQCGEKNVIQFYLQYTELKRVDPY